MTNVNMMGRFPDSMENLLASYRLRLEELERRLAAINDDPPEGPIDCCSTLCKFQSGTVTLAVGATNNTAVSLTVPRPASGRMVIVASCQLEYNIAGAGAGDFYTRTQLEIGGTRYFPIRRWRTTGQSDGAMHAPTVHNVFDFHGPAADLVVALYVQNLSDDQVIYADGQMTIMFRDLSGSAHCDPVSSGSG